MMRTNRTQKEIVPRQRRLSADKSDKNAAVRLRLIEAAARIIGRYGYSGCSISRITARAGVAHGAFYLHFANQQALFDEILPTMGALMLRHVSDAVHAARGVLELERLGLRANFDYLSKNPYMYRVLREAEVYAPTAFKRHLDDVMERYERSLQRSLRADQIRDFTRAELGTLASMLIGAREYLLLRFCIDGRTIRPLSDDMVEAYVRFVAHGLHTGQLGSPSP